MGLLDSIAGQVLGSMAGGGRGQPSSALMDVIGGLLAGQQAGGAGGGLGGLISAFEKNGLGDVMASWIGTGQNKAISADQLQSVLGNEQIAAIAQSLGFSPQEASGQLAQFLPQVIDQLTPSGKVPNTDALGGLLGSVLKGLGGR